MKVTQTSTILEQELRSGVGKIWVGIGLHFLLVGNTSFHATVQLPANSLASDKVKINIGHLVPCSERTQLEPKWVWAKLNNTVQIINPYSFLTTMYNNMGPTWPHQRSGEFNKKYGTKSGTDGRTHTQRCL